MTEIYIHTITKEEITGMDFSRFESLFGEWPQLRGDSLRRRYNSLAIFVSGYDLHPDEIYVISEVRAFFSELHRRWPWWLYFIHNLEASIAILYLCLLDRVESFKRENDAMCSAAFDIEQLLEHIQNDFIRMNFLMDRAGMTDEENNTRSQEILDLFVPSIGGEK